MYLSRSLVVAFLVSAGLFAIFGVVGFIQQVHSVRTCVLAYLQSISLQYFLAFCRTFWPTHRARGLQGLLLSDSQIVRIFTKRLLVAKSRLQMRVYTVILLARKLTIPFQSLHCLTLQIGLVRSSPHGVALRAHFFISVWSHAWLNAKMSFFQQQELSEVLLDDEAL